MIERLAGISIHGRCFVNPVTLRLFPGDNTRISLVYGANGSGKSTISSAIYSLTHDQVQGVSIRVLDKQGTVIDTMQHKPSKIFVFDESYIDHNVKIQNDGLGSIVLLGGQVDLQAEIDEETEKYNKESEKLTRIKSDRDAYLSVTNPLSPQYHWERIKQLLRGVSDWAKVDSEIKGNRQNSAVTDAIVREICSMKVDKTLEQLKEQFDHERSLLSKLSEPNPSYSNEIRQIILDSGQESKLCALLAIKIQEPMLTEREKMILALVQSGHQCDVESSRTFFSKTNKNICPYCYQSLSDEYKESLVASINRVLNKDVDQHKEQLSTFRLVLIENVYKEYSSLDSELIALLSAAIQKYNSVVESYRLIIQSKLQNIYTPIIQDELGLIDALREVNQLLAYLETKRKEFDSAVNQRSSIRDNLLTINKQIAQKHCSSTYQDYLKQNDEKANEEQMFQKQDKLARQIEKHLEELKQRKENIALAIGCINDALNFVFFTKERLSIELRGDKYYLKSNGHNVKPKNVSQGERNIIALCYYFIQIASNQDLSNLYSEEQLLIIDDPVSSFDFENKVGILSFLRRELKKVIFGNDKSKILILSHDLTAIFDLQKALEEICKATKADAKIADTNFAWLELKSGELRLFSKRRSEYACLIENVFSFALNAQTDEKVTIGNEIRRVLEAFSTFCYRKSIEDVSCDASILAQLKNYSDYFENRMYRLVLHGESHFEEQVYNFHDSENFFEFISESEKQNTARDILCFMFLLNPAHIKAYLPRAEQHIQNWCKRIPQNNLKEYVSQAEPAVSSHRKKKIVKLYDLPISAGIGTSIFDDDISSIEYRTDIEDCDFALRILGDSMEPDVPDGSIILVNKQETIDEGKIGAFFYNGEVYCKKLCRVNGIVSLVSSNPEYPPLTISEGDTLICYGAVIKIEAAL